MSCVKTRGERLGVDLEEPGIRTSSSFAGSAAAPGMLGVRDRSRGNEALMNSALFVFAAVDTGVVVIVVAVAVVLVVFLVTVSMRGRQRRGAKRRDEERLDVEEARTRTGGAESDRGRARGAEDLGPDR